MSDSAKSTGTGSSSASANDLAEVFHRELQAVEDAKQLSKTGTGVFDSLAEELAARLSISADDIYIVRMARPNNFNIRLTQGRAQHKHHRLTLGVIHKGVTSETLDSALNAARPFVGKGNARHDAIGVVLKSGGKWAIQGIIGDPSIAAQLKAAFPAMEVRSVSATLPQLDDLSNELFVPKEWLERVTYLLEDKRAIVFYGPPGTGKTYLARKLIQHLQPDPHLFEFVQLHPSYSYEDFFEGFRPTLDGDEGDRPALALQRGPLKRLAMRAAKADSNAYLLMDEMNRGNLPRVFGELYFLLEYRDAPVRLMYSRRRFRLPENLRFIGTMNTADRSLALVDQALRRRFHFVPLFPDRPPVNQMLAKCFAAHGRTDLDWIVQVLHKTNQLLPDPNVAIGPSHFMRDVGTLDEKRIEMIWDHSVLPTIEEYFQGRPEQVKAFALAELRKKVEGDASHTP